MTKKTITLRPFAGFGNILIRGTNWIGDAVLTLPSLAAVRAAFPAAHVSVLAKPWVAEVYALCPEIDEVILYRRPGIHEGIRGLIRLAGELRVRRFDAVILLQNAIEAAILSCLARIPVRAGYGTDGRALLLTHAVKKAPGIGDVHQTRYYLEMVKALGCRETGKELHLATGREHELLADKLLDRLGMAGKHPLVGIAPGAAYGPAKRWFPERFAAVADRLILDQGASILLFGSDGDRPAAASVSRHAAGPLVDIAGQTGLKEAIAVMARCDLFISNDSGLMHLATALGVPTVAIFGSTNPMTTAPVGKRSVVVRREVDCSPCLKTDCPTDFRCMDRITVEDILEAAGGLLQKPAGTN
ncbi:MAG: lipopolysaccharide heptosyltransferase II [Syntrophales bacterium]|nr:lipopolysaccharide heptosyltransferase II [Syntrophales bacterium]